MARTRLVKQNASGGWDVIKDGHLRSSVHADTKSAAVARARDIVRNEGGGEVRVMNHAGKVTDSNKVSARKSVAGARRRG
jgi:hypothetical protein